MSSKTQLSPEPAEALTAPSHGYFIAFEGADGAGKSTQSTALARYLRDCGLAVVQTREPGGTPISERLRELVLEHGHGEIDPRTEALMFAAARAAHVNQLIAPELERGTVVISDRFVDSSIAYQGVGRELGITPVTLINDFATQQLRPDLTILLDVDERESKTRRTLRHASTQRQSGEQNGTEHNTDSSAVATGEESAGEDRLEASTGGVHERIREAFLHIAEDHPDAYQVINAHQDPQQIAAQIQALVSTRLREKTEQGSAEPGTGTQAPVRSNLASPSRRPL